MNYILNFQNIKLIYFPILLYQYFHTSNMFRLNQDLLVHYKRLKKIENVKHFEIFYLTNKLIAK